MSSRFGPLFTGAHFDIRSQASFLMPLIARARAMHPALAVDSLAPIPSTTVSSLESAIGEAMSLAVAAIAQSLFERSRNGWVSAGTGRQATDLLTLLHILRQVCIDEGLDFDCIARESGKSTIARRWDQLKHMPDRPYVELTDAVLTDMVSWPLVLLARIVRARMH